MKEIITLSPLLDKCLNMCAREYIRNDKTIFILLFRKEMIILLLLF